MKPSQIEAWSERKPVRIGITIGLREESESLWTNGIKQNALYLARLFKNSPRGHQVVLVNTTAVKLTSSLQWDIEEYPVCTFEDAKDHLDILLELGGQLSAEQTAYLKQRGTKIVSYCCGPEYVQYIEAIIFNRGFGSAPFINQQYDEIWVIPQVVESSFHYFKTLRRQPAREVPFVWDPMCLMERSRQYEHAGEYRPGRSAKRLSIMEPNHDVLKFCLYPMLIVDSAYRAMPSKIEFLHVTNTSHLVQHSPEFVGIVQELDIVKDKKASFPGRFDTPAFLAQHTDIVVSHQWGLALNYFYFDVCWNGYPLIHNARLCADIGYFYNGNDVAQGAERLLDAIKNHDRRWQEYIELQRKRIDPYLSTNQTLIATYDDLVYGLLAS
ncbi:MULTISPECIES: DUF2827 domain-containing protein [Paraburkholderia]|uniref:DUF2827 domain-containing protein n=1 Tax=Paraburkholderia TaxID=1822464 RepID=UPI0022539A0A|nr:MULTISPECIES: DUF2827 domain-containing protein [Paraburkholderia]MCX4159621.1 DUF2827 domain-containing protein [Paraburkholderia aspalathi]MDN7169019.1 DUF2827 domain-containing protein [Paraburkholderia sp. SECH2]MDQ6397506.1 DUF2827 domain-containing protein [Paraburkholderia aspalathi]